MKCGQRNQLFPIVRRFVAHVLSVGCQSAPHRKFAILGDTGINDAVPEGFWDGDVEELQGYLKAGRPVDGLCAIIARMGERLSEYFPGERDDENELSNEVTFDDYNDDDEPDDHNDDDYGNME